MRNLIPGDRLPIIGQKGEGAMSGARDIDFPRHRECLTNEVRQVALSLTTGSLSGPSTAGGWDAGGRLRVGPVRGN